MGRQEEGEIRDQFPDRNFWRDPSERDFVTRWKPAVDDLVSIGERALRMVWGWANRTVSLTRPTLSPTSAHDDIGRLVVSVSCLSSLVGCCFAT